MTTRDPYEDDDDLAAELDDEPDGDVPDSPDDPAPTCEGIVEGGPWDGRTITTRCPKGFLLVDMPTRRLWIHDLAEDGKTFVCRSSEPEVLLDEGPLNRWRAVDEANYDLLVLDLDDENDETAGAS